MRPIYIILILFCNAQLFSQENEIELGCLLDICNSDDCGDVQVSYKPIGENVFCEEAEVIFQNTSSTLDFDFFIFSWGDGELDTIYDYEDVTHRYQLNIKERCEEGPKFSLQYCYAGFKYCDLETFSCSWQSGVVSVILKPKAKFDSDFQVCYESGLEFINTSCYGQGVLWDFGDGTTSTEERPVHEYEALGLYTVSLTTFNTCGSDTYSRSVRVVELPEAEYAASFDVSEGCIPATVSLMNLSSDHTFANWVVTRDTPDTTWCFIDTLQQYYHRNIDLILKDKGAYYITLESRNACGKDVAIDTIIALDDPSSQITLPESMCLLDSLFPAVNYVNENAIDSLRWTFERAKPDEFTSLFPTGVLYESPGIHSIRLDIFSSCNNISYESPIQITDKIVPEIQLSNSVYCSNDDPDTLRANLMSGIWSGPGIIDSIAGIFDPSLITDNSTVQISYNLNDIHCTQADVVDIKVNMAAEVNITPISFCISDPAIQLTADLEGGIWSGTGIVNENGLFNPALAGVGIHTVSYIVGGATCNAKDSELIIVEDLESFLFEPGLTLCRTTEDLHLNDIIGYSPPSSVKVFWEGPGIVDSSGIFNSSGIISDTVQLNLRLSNDNCISEFTIEVLLQELGILEITPDSSICSQLDEFQLNASIASGRWQGPGVNTQNGIINIQRAGIGLKTYSYHILENTSCEQQATVFIDIVDLSENLTAGSNEEYCEGQSTTLLSGNSPENGIWKGAFVLDSLSGLVSLDSLNRDEMYVYEYCISRENVANCTACKSKTLIVHSKPIPAFEVDDVICQNQQIRINNQSQNAQQFQWDFGNGTNSILQNPLVNYPDQGNYHLTLDVISKFNCINQLAKTVQVVGIPKAEFSLNNTSGCEPFEIEINNASSGYNHSIEWNYNGESILLNQLDGAVIDQLTEDSLIHIQLEASNLCGSDFDTSTLIVFPIPNANFGFNVDEGCSPLNIQFSNTSSGAPESQLWSLGNDSISFEEFVPDQTYVNNSDIPITFSVNLIASNFCGVDSISKPIVVYPPNVHAFIELDTLSGCPPLLVNPKNYSTPGSSIVWQWGLDNSDYQSSFENDPVIILNKPGDYSFILAASQCGTDYDTAHIQVFEKPYAAFTSVPEACQYDTIQYLNESIEATYYQWNIDENNQTQSSTHVDHQFLKPGIYGIELIAYNNLNCPDTTFSEIEIHPLPEINLSLDQTQGCPPLKIQTINNSDPNLQFFWNSNYRQESRFEYAPLFSFEESGVYTISATLLDSFNCRSDTIFPLISIFDLPNASFSLDAEYCIGYDTLRTINSSDGAIQYNWLINDTLYSSAQHIEFPVREAGETQLALIARNANLCADTSVQYTNILHSPIAGFEVSDSSICQGEKITLSNSSLFSDEIQIYYGDGNQSNDSNHSYQYSNPGDYLFTTIARTKNGCPADTQSITLQVYPNPIASFSYEFETECGDFIPTTFTNLSEGSTTGEWYLNNHSVAQIFNAQFEIPEGQNIIKLISKNSHACIDSFIQPIEVFSEPIAKLEIPKINICEGDWISLNQSGTPANQYIWEIPGIGIFENSTIDVQILESGVYDLSLELMNSPACRDKIEIDEFIHVFDTPVPDFSFKVDPFEDILGEVLFTNLSQKYNRVEWDFGDQSISGEENPLHSYDFNDSYPVVLHAFYNHNSELTCYNQTEKIITPEWITRFFAPNALSPDNGSADVRIFQPVGVGLEEYRISIYSPWGEVIWFSDQIDNGAPGDSWDGKLKSGQLAPQGVYVWKADITFQNGDSRTYTGSVHLIR